MSSFSLAGKQIVITGASGGIGATIVRSAAVQGAKTIVVHYGSNRDAADTLIKTLQGDDATKATRFEAVQGSLVDQTQCAAFVQRATSVLDDGKLDGLVLAAGSMKMVPLAQTNDASLANHFDLNVKGTLYTIQAALPHIRNDGRIVCFSTSVSQTAQALGPGYLEYTMCKAAVEQMVRVLQRDPSVGGPERRIGINTVAPGAIATPLFLRGKSDELIAKIGSITPEGRIGQPDEVAEAVVFLLTSASRWIRGQLVPVNGAQTL